VLRNEFAKAHDIPTHSFVEYSDEYIYRGIEEGEVGRLIAESTDNDRFYIKIKEVKYSSIVKEEKMTKGEIVKALADMELGLLGEFLTDNVADLEMGYSSRFAYIYSAKELADLVEEGIETDYNVSVNIPLLHDTHLMVTKYDNPHDKTMKIEGVGSSLEDFIEYFELEKVADKIINNNSLYERFLDIEKHIYNRL